MKLISKILLVLYVLAAFKNVAVYAIFEKNKEQIIAEICVEKDKEVNTCQGRCHLKEMIKEVENQSDEQDSPQLSKYEAEDNIIPNLLSYSLKVFQVKRKAFPLEKCGLSDPFSFSDFPPPKV